MAGFNQCTFVGNLTRDPKLSFTPNQTPVADFGLAVNHKWTGSDGVAQEDVCFIDVRAFGRTAENVGKYMTKGSPLLVSGRLAFETWTSKPAKGKEPQKHSRHRLIAERVSFLGSAKRDAGEDQLPATEEPER